MSRTSLREALRQLEAEGLINLVPYRGPEVAYLSLKEAEDICQMRELLEGFAGQQFAALTTPTERQGAGRVLRRHPRHDQGRRVRAPDRAEGIVLPHPAPMAPATTWRAKRCCG